MEVAIIGAGPAGSTLATLLAARGVAVTLFDRDEFPRDKLCGEFLSYDALPVLDALGVTLEGAPRISHCRVVGSKRTYAFDFPHEARGVSRMYFDDLLVRTAVARSAVLQNETVTALPQARVVVGAWGRWGRFDQQLHRSFVNVRDRNFGFKRHYRGPARDSIDLYSFRHGYLGVNAVEDGAINICGLVHGSRLSGHKGRWDAFVDTLRREEPQLESLYAAHEPAQEHFLSSEPVIFRARSAVEGGVFMIGDASGVIDPLTGNGMAMALQSAMLLAPLILRLLGGEDRATIEREYRARHQSFFAPRIRWSRAVAALLSRPRALDAALATTRNARIGAALLRRTRASREEVMRLVGAC
ncbi:MAG TPA: NAD(P)/FAD-dependent oxidoreductase [Thermoanaerobaculia bacterium]|nr:NAD(P)/FAD-dependent oxidoreductase [Thermoanaerobaculia bacterium]